MSEQNKVEELADNVKEYINTYSELMALKASDKISGAGSGLITGLLIWITGMLFLVFLSFAGAYYLSNAIGDRVSGFFIVAGIYLLAGLILVLFRSKLLVNPIRNIIIKEIFKDKKYEGIKAK